MWLKEAIKQTSDGTKTREADKTAVKLGVAGGPL